MAKPKSARDKVSDMFDKAQSLLYLIPLNGAELGVLLALFDSASVNPCTLLPSTTIRYSEVALRIHKNVHTVRASIHSLTERGYIRCDARPGDSNVTWILLEPITKVIQSRADWCEMHWVNMDRYADCTKGE